MSENIHSLSVSVLCRLQRINRADSSQWVRKLVVERLLQYLNEVKSTGIAVKTELANMNARDSRVFKSGETSQTARPSAACLMRRNLTRGRIAPTLRVKELLQPTGSGSPTTVTPVTEQLSSLNFGPLLSEEYLSRRAKLLVNEQMKEPPLGSVVTRGAPDVVISKKEMTRRFVATRAALFDAEEGKELQQRVWGVLMNKFALRLLVLGPPSSGKRKAVMTVGAQLRHLGIVIVVSYGKKRIQELIDSVRFVPPADLKPHWRGYGANFIVLNPDCLHDVSHKLSEVSMLIVDMFDQLIDFGLEVSLYLCF